MVNLDHKSPENKPWMKRKGHLNLETGSKLIQNGLNKEIKAARGLQGDGLENILGWQSKRWLTPLRRRSVWALILFSLHADSTEVWMMLSWPCCTPLTHTWRSQSHLSDWSLWTSRALPTPFSLTWWHRNRSRCRSKHTPSSGSRQAPSSGSRGSESPAQCWANSVHTLHQWL